MDCRDDAENELKASRKREMTLSSEVHDLSLLVTPRQDADEEQAEAAGGNESANGAVKSDGAGGGGERGAQAAKEKVQELEAEVRQSDRLLSVGTAVVMHIPFLNLGSW